MNDSSPGRPWTWLRRGLLVLLVVLAAGSFMIGRDVIRRRQQQAALKAVEQLGGEAVLILEDLSLSSVATAPWALPNDVWLSNLNLSDQDIQFVESMPELVGLHLGDNHITDDGLALLKSHTELRFLDLTNNPDITDAGLVHLKGLTNLEQLMLRNNRQITDAGLVHLENMQHLDLLILHKTSVTAGGVKGLKQKLPKARIGSTASQGTTQGARGGATPPVATQEGATQ